ncbi:MAG: peptidase [Bacteroidetes bacterium]|nr:MAG: peptidase [Bacteroidota bacterium]REK07076.1 MAG: peptidase [Bacteroidota bacterium]REK33750.1 MAG: peptidase [Bacteroidota bacterium]REK47257.1 MAG: peptidase [Bacteroidota bacterium]
MKLQFKALIILSLMLAMTTCKGGKEDFQKDVQGFLDGYNEKYRELYNASAEGQWKVNTYIVEGDTMNAWNSRQADEAMAAYTGSAENIKKAEEYLKKTEMLSDLQIRQLKKVLYLAAGNPESVGEKVKDLIKANTAQTEQLYGYKFILDGREITPNDIDSLMVAETDPVKRRKVWESSKQIGAELKPGLENLRDLRNGVVQGLGYSDYFSYQVSDYGMDADEMMSMLDKFNSELMPLYRELHTYMRYELAKKFTLKDVPDYIPAHLLSNRWGQDWSEMVTVEGLDLDKALKQRGAEWVARQGEVFYVSLGFEELPKSFWELSSIYPVSKDAGYKKNTHASAWHMDLKKDVRTLMSVTPNASWYETVHHEYGHIYYYLSYSNPQVPYILREGANRAYHEALGSLLGLAAMQKPFAAGLGLVDINTPTDDMKQLLKDALNYVVFIPWSAGTMPRFEYELYRNNLKPDEWNKKWWEIVKQYQGIVPPDARGEMYCDAATKTHINDDPAQYYDYALSYILLFQFHDHISKNILKQDPRATNYFGNKEVGKFIDGLMRPGSSVDWRKLLKESTGEDLSARAMLEYFSPLMDYLKKINEGRKYTI